MRYLDRGQTPAVGGPARAAQTQALQDDDQPLSDRLGASQPTRGGHYQLRYPAVVTNHDGWEVQCLADELGWINALLDDRERGLVFPTRDAAQAFMAKMASDSRREYRVYPSLTPVVRRAAGTLNWR
jgi:hypothetical protein